MVSTKTSSELLPKQKRLDIEREIERKKSVRFHAHQNELIPINFHRTKLIRT